jgi:hypothetical protein
MEDKLIFVIGSPRSGSTLLQRMLGAHSAIFTCPEPHIMAPLAHLGYYHTVEKAPYDHLRGVEAIRGFVEQLPNQEADYIDACRAYTDILYERRLKPGTQLFLDKTPANALVLDFITKLYPQSKYVVLTRHPVAIFSSYANSFFDGDYQAAQDFNPLLNRYVPAIARFLRGKPCYFVHIQYEQLVKNPEVEMGKVLSFLGLPFEPSIIEYGTQKFEEKGLGDPVSVNRHTKPMTKSVSRWAQELAADQTKLTLMQNIIDSLNPDDLKTWGYPCETIFKPLEKVTGPPQKLKKPPLDRFQIERKILTRLRRNIHNNAFGRIVKKVRFYCDVLLR